MKLLYKFSVGVLFLMLLTSCGQSGGGQSFPDTDGYIWVEDNAEYYCEVRSGKLMVFASRGHTEHQNTKKPKLVLIGDISTIDEKRFQVLTHDSSNSDPILISRVNGERISIEGIDESRLTFKKVHEINLEKLMGNWIEKEDKPGEHRTTIVRYEKEMYEHETIFVNHTDQTFSRFLSSNLAYTLEPSGIISHEGEGIGYIIKLTDNEINIAYPNNYTWIAKRYTEVQLPAPPEDYVEENL